MNRDHCILIIDHDENQRLITADALKAEGKILLASSSDEGMELAMNENPDIVLTELAMPVNDGIDFCLYMRSQVMLAATLIIFYTDQAEDYSQIAAFNAGADDYIIKPVKQRVLVSRLHAVLRRQRGLFQAVPLIPSKGIVIDRERYLIFREGEEIILPRKEFELLSLLSSAPRRVFTRKEISRLIWGYEVLSRNRTIDVHIRKLREKLGNHYIKTVKGVGYSLE